VYDTIQGPLTRKIQDEVMSLAIKHFASEEEVTAQWGAFDRVSRLKQKLAWVRMWVAHFFALFGSSLATPVVDIDSAQELAEKVRTCMLATATMPIHPRICHTCNHHPRHRPYHSPCHPSPHPHRRSCRPSSTAP
jgi:hypothetical protein